ncbi:unnamed protein product [Paramecium octaurelia]|uniref:Uncharacterized protein n=1 Tax=Paramecium octaurelia TaxID=43137 RepID=A0A8S1XEK5_PAROT|nr:unnamed protein product [Paramecium octaurelia]
MQLIYDTIITLNVAIQPGNVKITINPKLNSGAKFT